MRVLLSKYGYLYHTFNSNVSIGVVGTDFNGLSYLWVYNLNEYIW